MNELAGSLFNPAIGSEIDQQMTQWYKRNPGAGGFGWCGAVRRGYLWVAVALRHPEVLNHLLHRPLGDSVSVRVDDSEVLTVGVVHRDSKLLANTFEFPCGRLALRFSSMSRICLDRRMQLTIGGV